MRRVLKDLVDMQRCRNPCESRRSRGARYSAAVRVLVLTLLIVQAGCDGRRCGPGTVEVAGLCLVETEGGAAPCGPGTTWDEASETCVGADPVTCDHDTTVAVVDEDGTRWCVGSTPVPCGLPCAPAGVDDVVVCALLADGQSGELLGGSQPAGCDPGDPSGEGLCGLRVTVHDAETMTALSFAEMRQDACGSVVFFGVEPPPSGVLAIAVDDAVEVDAWVASRTLIDVRPGERHDEVRAYVLARQSDLEWTASAGDPFGVETFSDRGLLVASYQHGGQPARGVSITASGSVAPDDDYYFADTISVPAVIDPPRSATGRHGVGLLVGSGFGPHSGGGGDIAPCVWPERAAGTLAGYATFRSFTSVDVDTKGACP